MSRDDTFLEDILNSARVVQDYLTGVFLNNIEKQDASYRRFEIIGETARHLSPTARERFPDIPWPLIIGMRNILIHDYDDVDPKRVWETVQKDLPALISQLEQFLSNPSAD